MLFTSDRSRLMQTVRERVFFFLQSLNPTFPNSYSDFLEISAEARKGCVYECSDLSFVLGEFSTPPRMWWCGQSGTHAPCGIQGVCFMCVCAVMNSVVPGIYLLVLYSLHLRNPVDLIGTQSSLCGITTCS